MIQSLVATEAGAGGGSAAKKSTTTSIKENTAMRARAFLVTDGKPRTEDGGMLLQVCLPCVSKRAQAQLQKALRPLVTLREDLRSPEVFSEMVLGLVRTRFPSREILGQTTGMIKGRRG